MLETLLTIVLWFVVIYIVVAVAVFIFAGTKYLINKRKAEKFIRSRGRETERQALK